MSPFLSDADLAVTTGLAARRRVSMTVGEAVDSYAASLIDDYREALASGHNELLNLIRDHAQAIDPDLLDELDGFHYPAAA